MNIVNASIFSPVFSLYDCFRLSVSFHNQGKQRCSDLVAWEIAILKDHEMSRQSEACQTKWYKVALRWRFHLVKEILHGFMGLDIIVSACILRFVFQTLILMGQEAGLEETFCFDSIGLSKTSNWVNNF